VAGIALAPYAGRVVTRLGGLPTLLGGAFSGVAGFLLLAFLRAEPWVVIVAGLLTQLAVTVAYAALPALVVRAVREEDTGVANAVNSIARSVGQALGSTVAVTLIAGSFDPATGFPRDVAFTQVALIGALASLAVAATAVVGLLADRHGRGGRRRDALSPVEEAAAGAGEWSPVSGIR
jgi:MFS family permease